MPEDQGQQRQSVPYVRGSITSQAAAESMRPYVSAQAQRVLTRIRECGTYGATDDENELYLSIAHQAVSARRIDLEHDKLVLWNGQVRKTRSGRLAKVYVTPDFLPPGYEPPAPETQVPGKPNLVGMTVEKAYARGFQDGKAQAARQVAQIGLGLE
jgi:hypothetical protein